MNIVLTTGDNAQVSFHHHEPNTSDIFHKDSYRVTTCELSFNEIKIAKEDAHCRINDNFCKETGRKLSLTRALKSSLFSKIHRKQIWDAYFARKTK